MAAKLTVMRGMKGLKEAPRTAVKSRMETMLITPAGVQQWQIPDFQRPLKINQKVIEVSEEIKGNGGVINGVITLGVHKGIWYIVDGQHRLKAFEISALKEGLCDVRVCEFDSMTDMAEEFFRLQDHLVAMTPDDKLRALEKSHLSLVRLRQACPFVGYGNVRRSLTAPILSMSVVLRMWAHSASETPAHGGGGGVVGVARGFSEEDCHACSAFLNTMFGAWGRDAEYIRLWGGLNLTIVAWLYRRVVTTNAGPKVTSLTRAQFGKAAMALSASRQYVDWLAGRKLGEHDRSPCYQRIRQLLQQRLADEGIKASFPAPAWFTGGGSKTIL